MLRLEPANKQKNYRVLEHGSSVFHKALQYVMSGERRFHVLKDGEMLYDLYYVDNQQFAEASPLYVENFFTTDMPLFPPYLQYDETDIEKVCFDIVSDVKEIWFEEVSEYSVVIAKLLVENTDMRIFFKDERARWFFGDDKIGISDEDDCPDAMKIYGEFVPSIFDDDFTRLDAMVLFHHVFVLQWLTPLKLSDVKYVEFTLPMTEGIGSIFLGYGRGKAFFQKRYGFKVTLRPESLRYDDQFMRKYCTIDYSPEDSDEHNTIYVINYYALMRMRYLRRGTELNTSIFGSEFLSDLKSYSDAVMGGKKTLGMLLRGTDYIINVLGGKNQPVTVDTAIEKAKELLEEDEYDRIFLATEDQDILDKMKDAFGRRLITVAQERYRISDFTDELNTISRIDRARHPGKEDYDAFVEDVTVNYFFAMYLLSQCETFVYSCNCSGVAIVMQFGGEGIKRAICLADCCNSAASH